MPVHPDLLAAAAANDHAAIDMVNLWGHGYAAGLGGSARPGVWMVGAGERLLERCRARRAAQRPCRMQRLPRGSRAAARGSAAPTLLISGERDQMTPLKGGARSPPPFAARR